MFTILEIQIEKHLTLNSIKLKNYEKNNDENTYLLK